MKILSLIILLSFCFDSFAQNRKELLKEIKGYTYGEIRFSSIETDEETYKDVIKNYFLQSGYKQDTIYDSLLLFKKRYSYKNSVKIGTVEISIFKKDQSFDLISQKNMNANKFLEQDLRTFIYIHYKGNSITIPEKLMKKIENYNDRQKKERRKLVEGRDY